MHTISRRALIKSGLMAAGVSLGAVLDKWRANAESPGDDIATILALAATAEMIACTAYYTAFTRNVPFSDLERSALKAAMDSELRHLAFFRTSGGNSLVAQFYFPSGAFIGRGSLANFVLGLEGACVGLYLAATRRAAELGNPGLAATFAQIAGVEQQHVTLARSLGGLLPNAVSLPDAPFYNPSEMIPMLQGFLEGGEGFTGPVAFPGESVVRSYVGADTVSEVAPLTTIHIPTVVTAPQCVITAGNANANIRRGPGVNFPVVAAVPARQSVNVIGQTIGKDGYVWWQVEQGWISSMAVYPAEGCEGVPMVEFRE